MKLRIKIVEEKKFRLFTGKIILFVLISREKERVFTQNIGKRILQRLNDFRN